MTLDFWGLGLQAVNVLILIWLLGRVFWRPVAAAIAQRQETAKSLIDQAKATQHKADTALDDATKAHAGLASKRAEMLDLAKLDAETASQTALTEARTKAKAMLTDAKATLSHDAAAARKANESHASDLALRIAARLLERLQGPAVQSAFLSQLVDAIADMSDADRKALVADPNGVEIASATDANATQETIETTIRTALGGAAQIRFTTDPSLIAGVELRSPHLVLHNSWQADLAQISKAVLDAA